ncbi:MAG: hypothetical protein LBM04_11660, partial [Opitutaceae bacterium]|nr:hypothetical protein [Opitutaceae bacterium]
MSALVLTGAPAGESGPAAGESGLVAGLVAIDFSHAGYGGGGGAAPAVPAVLRVRPTGGDDTAMLQAALDRVAAHPLRDGGFRGALALAPGVYRVGGQLRMDAGGVVLHGIAADDGALPVIRATGSDRRTLICLGQKSSASASAERKGNGGGAARVADETVPAGACELTLESSAFESPGDIGAGARVIVTRPSTKAWIDALGMAADDGAFAALRTHWLPGSRDLVWDRTVVAVDRARNRITLDAPLTTALERRFGGGTVAVRAGAPVTRVGVENLILESEFDPANPRDEEHAWIAVAVDNIEDAWVRGVTA